MNIPKINQIPLSQPMYINGQLHQTWINFFEQMGRVADVNGIYSLQSFDDAIQQNAKRIEEINTAISQQIQEIQNHFNKEIQAAQDSIQSTNDALSQLEQRVKALEDDKDKT